MSKNVDLPNISGLHGGKLTEIVVLSTQKWSCFSGEEWSVFRGWLSRFLVKQLENERLFTLLNLSFCAVPAICLRHVQVFKKKVNICIALLRMRTTFLCIRLIFKHSCLNPWSVTFHDLRDVFRSSVIRYCILIIIISLNRSTRVFF